MGNTEEGTAGISSDEMVYRNKVSAITKQLVALNMALNAVQLAQFDEAELLVRLEFVEDLNKSFDQALSTLEVLDPSIGETTTRYNFITIYFEAKAKLTRKLNCIKSEEPPQRSSTFRQYSLDETQTLSLPYRRSRLPELKIPSFSGSYIDWPDFFAMFCTVVDKDDIPKIEKLQHLRSCLKGAALDTISSLEPTEANYDKAIELLKRRFDNKLVTFQAHIKEIFDLKISDKGSALSLRQLSDKLNAHMRALQTMSTKEEIADGFLLHVVTSKLDVKSKAKWEEDLPVDQFPTWTSLEIFLDKRCRFLEKIENTIPAKSLNASSRRSSLGRNVLVTSTSTASLCTFCNSKEHFITKCSRFENLSPTSRFKEAKKLQLCLNCLKKGHILKNCKSGHCRHCSSKHHSLLHIESASDGLNAIEESSPEEQSVLISSSACTSHESLTVSSSFNVLLATAIVLVKNCAGSFIPCRAILDSASQLNFVTNRLANQLQLQTNKSLTTINGIGDGAFVAEKSVDIFVKSQNENFSTSLSAIILPSITDYKPNIIANVSSWNIPKNVKLADPYFYKVGRVDILIGASLFFELMCVGQIRLDKTLPILQKTVFGWVVSGGTSNSSNHSSLATICRHDNCEEENNIENLISSFWEIENNFSNSSTYTNDDIICENFFQRTTIRLSTGEYSVSLPKRESTNMLGVSFDQAKNRFKGLEKRLHKFPEIKKQYIAFMKEYLNLNHMSPISSSVADTTYFLPHHCVQKADSSTTKLRVVFDGSAKTSSGLSLNDILYVGPTIQPKLFNTLLRFRFFKVAISGDICKMYRCVKVSHPDDYLQCIIWRENPNDELKAYKLNTVTYGTRPAAFLAIRAMHQLVLDEEENFPLGAKTVKRDFYVDDMISGADTVEEAKQIRTEVERLLKKGNFLIRKWCSNESSVLDDVPLEDCEQFLKFHDGTDVLKTLGLAWSPKEDKFIFSFLPTMNDNAVTKRSILSLIARIYDPLGLVGPIITKAKILMQVLWKHKLHWDESLPQSLHSAWCDFVSKLYIVDSLKFPRYVLAPNATVQIHAFCDASLAAYGACVYLRTEINGIIKTTLLCSKSRVAPLKTITIPKLELSAALLLAELVKSIEISYPTTYETHCWSDSMIVLSWLREQSSNFNVFVSNRVSRIQLLTNNMNWHHVPSNLNPADILSRGALPEELLVSKLWKNGPDFLSKEHSTWPKLSNWVIDLPERKQTVLITTPLNDWALNCKYHNSFNKMQRIFGYVYKFVIVKFSINQQTKLGSLTPFDLKMGTHMLIRNIQQLYFASEYRALKSNNAISPSSKLNSLAPFIDTTNLIRVGGRLENSILDFDAKHPIILPKLHPFTRALVMDFHQRLLHAGPQSLIATIRLQYWPLGGRKAVSTIISKCIRCFRLKPACVQHIMGNLPRDRVQQCRAFHTTGLDFCGPFYYKSDVRSRPPVKSYICIFICFATKASHLELVAELSTQSFLCALKRFISIRGKPQTIWSDNATNFVGAKNELEELKRLVFSQPHLDIIQQDCLNNHINWKFIPPRSPHFGGLWEAAVKSAKYHFYRTVGQNILKLDDLQTLVYQISAILNSRPLCPLSDDPNDLNVLTPGHFLIGGPLTSIIEPEISDENISHLSRWQKISFLQQTFWKKWSAAYLTLLQERSKWRAHSANIAKDDIVLLKEDNLPPLKWQVGRVIDTISGADGVVRVAVVRACGKTVKRSVTKMAVLPIERNIVKSQSLSTGGGC